MIWIIGTGLIAQEYAKILNKLGEEFIVVGRSGKNAQTIINLGAKEVLSGGLDNYINSNPAKPEKAIVATTVTELAHVCKSLMAFNVTEILCEKPGYCEPLELLSVLNMAREKDAHIFYAYNRRCFASTLAAEKIIIEDGGVKSFNFEFTEWSHVIETLDYSKIIFNTWFFHNSSHVIDLAFFLGGEPKNMSCYTAGELSWHKPASFAGSGVTKKGALFSYQANWAAPGRWGVEILTSKHRLYLRPMEKLQIQNIGSVALNDVEIDDFLDKEFKPGFYIETKLFLEGNIERLCSLEQQIEHITNIYMKIIGR